MAGRIKGARRDGEERCGCFGSWRRTLEAKEGVREAIVRNLIDSKGEGQGNVFMTWKRKRLGLETSFVGLPMLGKMMEGQRIISFLSLTRLSQAAH